MQPATVTLSDKFSAVKIAGLSIATVLGGIVTFSVVRANYYGAKVAKGNINKLKKEGYLEDDALDKMFAAIEKAAGFHKKPQTPATPVANADKTKTSFDASEGIIQWADPKLGSYLV
jgi:hypothetical protein